MGKLRVHELAKKLGLQNQELVEKLTKAGLTVKTHSSTVDEAEAMKAFNADRPKAAPVDAGRPRTMVRRFVADAVVEPPPVVVEPPRAPIVSATPNKPVAAALEPAVSVAASVAAPVAASVA